MSRIEWINVIEDRLCNKTIDNTRTAEVIHVNHLKRGDYNEYSKHCGICWAPSSGITSEYDGEDNLISQTCTACGKANPPIVEQCRLVKNGTILTVVRDFGVPT